MANPKVRLPNPTHVIYALSVDGINHRYVGYTGAGGIRRRMLMHRYQARHQHAAALYEWMREQDIDTVLCVVLEKLSDEATVAELGEREQYWIAKLRNEGHMLFNITDGGAGAKGYRHPLEVREQIAAKARGRTYPPETIARMSAASRGRKLTPEHRAKLSEIRAGKKHTKRHEFADPAAQADSGVRGAHNRWHAARGIVKDGCTYCTPS